MDELIGTFGLSEDGGDTRIESSKHHLLNVTDGHLLAEVEEGNVEFKLKLVNPTPNRLEHLVTQMKWRLREGHGEAIYEIGVEDDGLVSGLSPVDLEATLETLEIMAKKLHASVVIVREQFIDDLSDKKAVEVLVRQNPGEKQFIDIRICMLGNVDAGKSTLVGVLTGGECDNGHGRARLNLFRHRHEIQTGRTTSICHEIIGFDAHGQTLDYTNCRNKEQICESASKLVSFIDLPGCHKSLKTTVFGLTGYFPDIAFLVIAANSGIVGTTREHLGIALALGVQIVAVITKEDLVPSIDSLEQKLRRMFAMPGVNQVLTRVKSLEDCMAVASNMSTNSIVPLFVTSSVDGKSLNLLKHFLNVIPPRKSRIEVDKLCQQSAAFKIDEVYDVPSVGPVVGGLLKSGVVRCNDELLLGPFDDGSFCDIRVQSLQRNRSACSLVKPDECATMALGKVPPLRKGMVIVDRSLQPCAVREFDADVFLLFHPVHSGLPQKFQCTVHIDNIVQSAMITPFQSLKTNEKGKVHIRFMRNCEYVVKGMRIFFRERRTKGIGHVCRIFPFENDECSPTR